MDPYSSTYYYNSSAGSDAFTGVLLGMLGTYSIIVLVWAILQIIAMWRIFQKAGEAGWKSIIPVYNLVILYKISGLSPWLILLFLIPFVGWIAAFVLSIIQNVKLAEVFGKSGGFAVGLIFLQPIFYMILGFGRAEYQKEVEG